MINGYLGDLSLSFPQGTIFDAPLIRTPSLTKKKNGKRDPDMHQAKKGNQYYFGPKAHVGASDESGLVHSVVHCGRGCERYAGRQTTAWRGKRGLRRCGLYRVEKREE